VEREDHAPTDARRSVLQDLRMNEMASS
jgi:hypothetical protein